MKRFHGLGRSRGHGLKSKSMQAKLTALAVNLKRIAALVSSVFSYLYRISWKNGFLPGSIPWQEAITA